MRNFILVIVILIGLISGAANSLELEQQDLATERRQWRLYKRWLSHHKISRSHRQKHRRFNVFKHNARHVLNVNQMNKPYKLRLNMFGDMSNQEFLKLYAPNNITLSKNLYSANNNNNNIDSGFMYQKATNLPNHMDWREKGAVNKIKDQHTCMSCWAFSATAAIEGINQIKTKKLVSLSEQELIDCDPWSNGCYGGFVDSAFDFVYQNGISTHKNYPYYNSQQYCSYSMMMNSPRVTIDGYERVPRNNERALMKAVAHQPVSVAIASSGSDFQFYWKGVFDGYCGPDINHAVVAIGYGTSEDGDDYWLVRNSWGTWWGDEGYIKLKRGLEYPSGQCGIAESPIYPIKNR